MKQWAEAVAVLVDAEAAAVELIRQISKNQRSLISERESRQKEVDDVLNVAKDMNNEYGTILGDFFLADIGGRSANAMAYSDGENIGFNSKYFNDTTMQTAYERCVKQGFHPSKGNKTAMEAVAAHEYGHVLTEAVGRQMGITGIASIDSAATFIVKEARKSTSHKGVVQMARKISGYATFSNAEAVAEAVADVYCNGGKAKSESRAIVNVINRYLKP